MTRRVPGTLPKGIMEKISKHLKWVDEPFDKKTVGKLKADVVYTSGKKGTKGKYLYTTDSKGRLSTAHAHPLVLDKTKRASHAGNPAGKQSGDHAGHIFGDIFGGSPKLDNIVSQTSHNNLSRVKKLENNWAKELGKTPPSDIKVDVKVLYGSGGRPVGFQIDETINGVATRHNLRN